MIEAEYGSNEPFGYWKTTLHDQQGNEIKTTCKCGNKADTCIMGVTYHEWICNDCAFGTDQPTAKFVFKPPVTE